VPTQDELDDCPYVMLTDDNEWDPGTTDLTDPMPKQIMEMNTFDTDYQEASGCETDKVLSLISSVYSREKLRNRVLKSVRIMDQVASQTSIRTPSDPVSTYEPGISNFKFEKIQIRARISPMHAGIKYFYSFFIQ
jgi:hypothetical protein